VQKHVKGDRVAGVSFALYRVPSLQLSEEKISVYDHAIFEYCTLYHTSVVQYQGDCHILVVLVSCTLGSRVSIAIICVCVSACDSVCL